MTVEQRIRDLETLLPREQVKFMLALSESLLGAVEHYRPSNPQTAKVFGAFDLALERTRRWLKGELLDPEALRYPVYNDDGTDIADTALTFRRFLPDADIEYVGGTITHTALYAAFLQYKQDRVEFLPHPYEGDMDEDELASRFERNFQNYSTALKVMFEELWEARFLPAAKPD